MAIEEPVEELAVMPVEELVVVPVEELAEEPVGKVVVLAEELAVVQVGIWELVGMKVEEVAGVVAGIEKMPKRLIL